MIAGAAISRRLLQRGNSGGGERRYPSS